MATRLEIISCGPSLTVQDRGRPGYLACGVSAGGAMDPRGLAEGRGLLGNSPDCAAIEMVGTGGRFTPSGGAVWVALTGAPFRASICGAPVKWRTAFRLEDGQMLDIGPGLEGNYGYLSVGGGFDIPPVLGSRATQPRAGIGGVDGRSLRAGDRLPVGKSDHLPDSPLILPPADYFSVTRIRILWGAQAHLFPAEERSRFTETRFRISTSMDRMGVRLETDADPIRTDSGLVAISDSVVLGDLQVPGNGRPIALMADRQPTGGYPRIATIISADIPAFAQLRPGTEVLFTAVDEAAALEALRQMTRQVERIRSSARPLIRDPRDIPDLLSYNLIDGVIAGRDIPKPEER
ncbi:MAG: biotin-dependent carboxyltransferase family protein [Rhodospirillales bacterium]